MAIVKLEAGETIIVVAVDPSLEIGGGPIIPPEAPPPVDPGYGIDLGLGYLRPTHPIVLPPPTVPIEPPPEGPVDPAWGIDEDIGYLRPTHPIVLPPLPTPTPPKPEVQWEIRTAWTPVSGWIVVAVPTGEHAAPG